MRALVLAGLLPLLSCVGHGAAGANASAQVANAAIGTALGLTAAGVSRASGGCYASCPVGTTCNEKTGYCEELPCRGQCGPNEVCETSGHAVPTCVSAKMPELKIGRTQEPERVTPQ